MISETGHDGMLEKTTSALKRPRWPRQSFYEEMANSISYPDATKMGSAWVFWMLLTNVTICTLGHSQS